MANKDDKWVRKVADDYGIDQSLLDYDAASGYVTLAGQNLAKPTEVTDGKSYFDDLTDVYRGFDDYIRNNGDAVVKVTDYLAASGVPSAASYTGGVLSVGGQTVPTVRVTDGKAYAKQSDLDRALSSSPTKSNQSVVDEAYSGYGTKQAEALDAIANREAFSYNPEEDILYQAYKDQYTREANRAVQDAMAAYSAGTGGMANSMAVTGAGQAREQYMQKLNDVIPELYAQAYDRYQAEGDELRYLADAYAAAADQWLSANYQANRDTVGDITAANKANAERDRDARDTSWEQQMDTIDQAQDDRELSQADRALSQADRELSQGDRKLDQADRELSQEDRALSQNDRKLDQTDRSLDLDAQEAAWDYQLAAAKAANSSKGTQSSAAQSAAKEAELDQNIESLSTDLSYLGFDPDELTKGALDKEHKYDLLVAADAVIRYISQHFVTEDGANYKNIQAYLQTMFQSGGITAPMFYEISKGYSFK